MRDPRARVVPLHATTCVVAQPLLYPSRMTTHLSPSTMKRMDRAGRAGFVAKGAVYAIIGWYALEVVLGRGGAFLDKEDVAKKVELQPYGQVLLAVLGAGLACYALWRFVQ